MGPPAPASLKAVAPLVVEDRIPHLAPPSTPPCFYSEVEVGEVCSGVLGYSGSRQQTLQVTAPPLLSPWNPIRLVASVLEVS